ncbi:hypothetical protein GQ600_8081 [Phytophthora cactorum]|nr:hypothetical protein GQ600_8081 [Phytophthora cactorum]
MSMMMNCDLLLKYFVLKRCQCSKVVGISKKWLCNLTTTKIAVQGRDKLQELAIGIERKSMSNGHTNAAVWTWVCSLELLWVRVLVASHFVGALDHVRV